MQRVYEYSESDVQIEFENILEQNIANLTTQGFYNFLTIYLKYFIRTICIEIHSKT